MPGIDFQQIFIQFLVLVSSLSVHEAAHAWTADRLGDPTARMLGRVSINPAVHVDPIGTVRDIYDHYDLAWSEEFAERLNCYLQQNGRGKHGAHLYAPETFGQTGKAISERFVPYIERFELTSPNGIQ